MSFFPKSYFFAKSSFSGHHTLSCTTAAAWGSGRDPRTVSRQVTPGAAAVQKQLQTSHQNPQPLLDNTISLSIRCCPQNNNTNVATNCLLPKSKRVPSGLLCILKSCYGYVCGSVLVSRTHTAILWVLQSWLDKICANDQLHKSRSWAKNPVLSLLFSDICIRTDFLSIFTQPLLYTSWTFSMTLDYFALCTECCPVSCITPQC